MAKTTKLNPEVAVAPHYCKGSAIDVMNLSLQRAKA